MPPESEAPAWMARMEAALEAGDYAEADVLLDEELPELPAPTLSYRTTNPSPPSPSPAPTPSPLDSELLSSQSWRPARCPWRRTPSPPSAPRPPTSKPCCWPS